MNKIQGYRSKTVNVSQKTIDKIKRVDNNPFFTEYVLIHSGEAEPNILGEQSKPIIWSKLAIQSFYQSIKTRIKAFINHNKDNSTENRQNYGELVEKRIDKLDDGTLAVIGIFYHTAQQKKQVEYLDVISHEGKWEFEERDGKLHAKECDQVTGFALGSSKESTPAFKNAVKIGAVQCMAQDSLLDHLDNSIEIKEKKEMNINDVIKFIADNGITPSKLFAYETIKEDPKFSKNLQEYDKKLADEKAEKEKIIVEKTELSKKLQETIGKVNNYEKPTIFQQMVKDKKVILTENEKQFIEKSLVNYNGEVTEEKLSDFVKAKQEDYKIFQQVSNSVDTSLSNDSVQLDDSVEIKEEQNDFI